jgi:hypothetical protein
MPNRLIPTGACTWGIQYFEDMCTNGGENITITVRTFYQNVRFEVFTAVTMKNGVFWDVTPCGSCKNQRFGGT